MASNLSINTGNVVNTAYRINYLNQEISKDFKGVEDAVKRINNSWNSQASSHILGHFSSIQTILKENRYNVMDDYFRFLVEQVADGYEVTESTNKKLADSFK